MDVDERQGLTEITELSLNSLVGISSPRTMKLQGMVQTEKVTVMIDSGATHNFISDKVIRRLGLSTVKTHSYGVVTGTGMMVQGVGICRGVKLQIQDVTVVTDFLPLELGSADVTWASSGWRHWAT